jgi:hypothetical protein
MSSVFKIFFRRNSFMNVLSGSFPGRHKTGAFLPFAFALDKIRRAVYTENRCQLMRLGALIPFSKRG